MSVCWICGAGLADPITRRAHYAAEHPGYRVTWRNRDPLVIAPDGSERIVGRTEGARMKRHAEATARGAKSGATGRPRVKVESFGPPAEPGPGLRIEPEAAGGSAPAGTGSASGPTRVSQAPVHPTVAAVQGSVKDAVRDAFDVTMLAGLVRDFSVSLSDADGAGQAGHLSATQSMMVARLMYDSTVDFVVDRFGGNVGRFKMALAVMVVVLSKGSVHAKAIGVKINERGFSAMRGKVIAPPPPPLDPLTPDYAANYQTPLDEPGPNDAPVADVEHSAGPIDHTATSSEVIAELARAQAAYVAREAAGHG